MTKDGWEVGEGKVKLGLIRLIRQANWREGRQHGHTQVMAH